MKPQLVIALDNIEMKEAETVAKALADAGVSWFKVGFETYIKGGNPFISYLKDLGANVFLDLKLHDIPNTVAQAIKAAANLGVDLMTLHCFGGATMLEAATDAAKGTSVHLVGVTVLTSHSDLELAEILSVNPSEQIVFTQEERVQYVKKMIEVSVQAGLSGVVSSAADLQLLKDVLVKLPWKHSNPLFVTPGIREMGGENHDQYRVATPQMAIAAGANMLVVGRPILKPESGTYVEAAQKYLKWC